MSVIHILRDGTRVNDITGRVVRVEDAEPLYRLVYDMSLQKKKEVAV